MPSSRRWCSSVGKTKIYTVPDSDLKWETFRAGGKGGQNANKRDMGARVTHIPSGISHEGREERQQIQNRRSALQKLADDPKFKIWVQMHIAANKEGFESVAAKVEEAMDERNLRIETAPDCAPGEAHCDRD